MLPHQYPTFPPLSEYAGRCGHAGNRRRDESRADVAFVVATRRSANQFRSLSLSLSKTQRSWWYQNTSLLEHFWGLEGGKRGISSLFSSAINGSQQVQFYSNHFSLSLTALNSTVIKHCSSQGFLWFNFFILLFCFFSFL